MEEHILVVFAYRTSDDSEYLTRTIHDDRLIFGIGWDESELLSFLLEVLQRHITLERCDDDIPILRGKGPIEDDDIPLPDTSILHAISLHLYEICTCWMLNKILLEVHLTRRMRLRSEWKSSTY